MNIQSQIQDHYKARISDPSDDHMHIGGKKATAHFAEKMAFKKGESVLDVGCGLGGPARFVAENYDVYVTGIDLSPDNVSAARALSTGLNLRFDLGDGQGLPYEIAAFDAAMVLHVGMNVPDKAALYREIARVLKPGGRLGVYDIFETKVSDDFIFPMPWAKTPETSFLERPDIVRGYMEQAGFRVISEENRYDFAVGALEKTARKSRYIYGG
ncbi:MAG: class I SAM-dependent methyltransferase [Alphaproteobacteria bacterium]|nr:class I SAM-dependent methyltransferase [Alphaproteobacteria bacterium]